MSQIPQLMSGRALEHGIALAVDHGGTSSKKMHVGGQAAAQVAASAALSNDADPAELSEYKIPANTLVAGSTIRVRAAGIASAYSTGNLTITLKLGSETLATDTVTPAGANEIYDFQSLIQVRTAGSTGTAVAISNFTVDVATDSSTRTLKASFTLDTTAEKALQLVAEWGAANAGNSIRSDIFVVDIVNPQT